MLEFFGVDISKKVAGKIGKVFEEKSLENKTPGLYRIGCLGRLSSFSESDDGRYLITLTGVARFAVSVPALAHSGR